MKNTSKILIALGAGLLAGGVLGVLFAPDEGSLTRHKIAESPKKLADSIRGKIKIGKEKLEEALSLVNSEIGELV